ncbi:MAG: hypothetical protein V1929_05165 [bacterium]
MPDLRPLLDGATPRDRTRALVLLAILAFVLRFIPALTAYPTPTDSAHFVQFGMELAQGNPLGFSEHWSQWPILLAALAIKLNLDPGRALQASTVVAGVIAVCATVVLCFKLTGRWRIGLLAGFFAATNPSMIEYSVNSMGEMPYLAVILSALGLAIPAGPDGRVSSRALIGGFFLLGVSIYYRPTEACTAAFFLAVLSVAFSPRDARKKTMIVTLAGLFIFACWLVPLTTLTRIRTGSGTPSAKIVNLAFGDYGTDSKALYAVKSPVENEAKLLREKGVVGYIWLKRNEMTRRWVRNMGQCVRIMKDQLLPASFKLGSGWFVLGGIFAALAAWRHRHGRLWLCCLPFVFSMPALFSLSFVFPRWLIPSLPFLILLLSGTIALVSGLRPERIWKAGLAIVFGLMMLNQAAYGIHAAGDGWRGRNIKDISRFAREHGSEDDVLMAIFPQYAIHFYKEHPFRWKRLHYGSIDEVEQAGEGYHATLVIVAGQEFGHWPIHKLFEGTAPPPNWHLLGRKTFERLDPKWGLEVDDYLIYRREAPHAAEPVAEHL